MSSIGLVFVVIVGIFSGLSFQQKVNNKSLSERLCKDSSLNVDSIVPIYGTNLLYLIAGNLVFKMEMKANSRPAINSTLRLEDWSSEIKPPINWIYTTRSDPKHISLINCAMKKEWIIRHEDNHYKGSKDFKNCFDGTVEYTMNSKTGEQYVVEYLLSSDTGTKDLVVTQISLTVGYDIGYTIGHFNEIKDINIIKGYDSRKRLNDQITPFTQIKGKDIMAALLYNTNDWFLFAGRYYCKLRLLSFEDPCKPLLISDWIETCALGWVDPAASVNRPKDISLYVFIVMAIITVAIVVIVIIVLLIAKEWKKRGTYVTQPSGSYRSSVQS